MSKFYVTTTTPYVNAEPHIGFALEIIQADAIARYHTMLGDEVVFNTGTDEHGQKIYQKALEANKDPQAYTDEYSERFRALITTLNLSVTNFIRTTDPTHKQAAQTFWRLCADNGDIYKKNYKTKYCVGCELQKTDSELSDGKCPIHPNLELQLIEEENYFFRWSKYQEPLLRLYQERPELVLPDFRMKEIRNFVEKGLEDFSISRLKSKMPWGVPVPDDDEHVMYVWFDALVNYISTIGWPEDPKFNEWWPVVQLAGKDNLRQQSAMWQAMLLSAGLPPSKQILIHGFITVDGKKMSKSLGNVIDPIEVVKQYGVDALRYYLLAEIPSDDDGDFTWERFRGVYNADLANDLGNLVQRVATMINKYQDNVIGDIPSHSHDITPYREAMENYRFDRAIAEVKSLVRGLNQYIEEEKPWKLAKEDPKHLQEVLAYLVSNILQVGVLLEPFIPDTAATIKSMFADGLVREIVSLFPRHDQLVPEAGTKTP